MHALRASLGLAVLAAVFLSPAAGSARTIASPAVQLTDRLVVAGSSTLSVGTSSALGVGALEVDGRVEKKCGGAVCVDSVTLAESGVIEVAEGVLSGGTNAVTSVRGRLDVSDGAGIGAPQGTTLDVTEVAGAGTFVKEGAGRANVYAISSTVTSLDVRGGMLALPSAVLPSGAWFHVDASRADTLTTVEENGTNFVTRWSDADGGSVYATAGTRPFLNTNALGGRATVDFGSYHYPTEGVTGYGGYMDWSATDGDIREVFVVCSDTEDVASLPGNLTGNFLLGDSDVYDFHRGLNRSLFIAFTAPAILNGLIEVDGETRAMDYPLPDGFHLVHLCTTGNVRANAFARNRSYSYGGQRIAEMAVYNRTLTDEEARLATLGLLGKWRGTGVSAARAFETLRVAENAVLDLSGMAVSASNLLCRGTIRAASLAPEAIRLTSDGAGLTGFTLDGRLAAGTPGRIVLDGAVLPQVAGATFAFATVDGVDDVSALARWSVEGSAIPAGWSGRLVLLDGNRLAVRLGASEFIIMVR